MTTPESITILVHGEIRTISYELALRRLFNRAIEIATDPKLRNDIAIIRSSLEDIEVRLQGHYQELRRKEIRDSFSGAAQRRALQNFAESQKRFLPPLWLRAFETARNMIMLQFLDYHMVATIIDIQEGSLDSWHAAWPTVVIPEIVKIAARNNMSGLDDPLHRDLITADAMFNGRALPQLQVSELAGQPRRSLDHPHTVIEYRLSTPRSFFTVDLMADAIHFHPEAKWTQAIWDLWVTDLEPSVEFG